MKRILLTAMTALALNACTSQENQNKDAVKDGVAALMRRDDANALTIFQPLAAQGDADAQNMLGWMYYQGRGVAQNYTEAAKWYRQAAEQGNGMAQGNLGFMYEYGGGGVTKDSIRADMWYQLGALSGDDFSALCHDTIANGLTPKLTAQQIAQAKSMALACKRHNFKGCD